VTMRCVGGFVGFALVCSLICTPDSAAAQSTAALAQDLPNNIQIEANLRPLVSMLLRKSSTFRRQCVRISLASNLRIVVLAIPPLREASAPRARATFTRFLHGAIRVVIEIPVASDYVELLPHELEHVIEQLEGVNLATLARRGGHGVIEIDPGVFETARARAAGLAVVDEVFAVTDPAITGASRRLTRAFRVLRGRAASPGAARTARPGR